MKRTILAGVLVLTSGLTALWAQKPKSPAEMQAVQAVSTAADPDSAIKAAEELLTKYSDTEFKEFALMMEARAYQEKRDSVNAQIFGERALQINPKSYLMENLVATVITQGIGEHDLDRADKLAKATKLYNDAIDNVKTATKPNPQLPDDQWAQAQKYTMAESHNGLGMLAQQQKKWDDAVKEYQLAMDGDPEQDAYATRLANALLAAGKPAEALDLCNKILAKPSLHPQIKQVVESIKKNAEAAKK